MKKKNKFNALKFCILLNGMQAEGTLFGVK